ncbi:MAG: hypothetical protein V5A27_12015 [Halapricum sp.]
MKCDLDRRPEEAVSSNDALKRVLDGLIETDFYDGFESLPDEQAEGIREQRDVAEEERQRRMR